MCKTLDVQLPTWTSAETNQQPAACVEGATEPPSTPGQHLLYASNNSMRRVNSCPCSTDGETDASSGHEHFPRLMKGGIRIPLGPSATETLHFIAVPPRLDSEGLRGSQGGAHSHKTPRPPSCLWAGAMPLGCRHSPCAKSWVPPPAGALPCTQTSLAPLPPQSLLRSPLVLMLPPCPILGPTANHLAQADS